MVDLWLGGGGPADATNGCSTATRTPGRCDPRHDRELRRDQLASRCARAASSTAGSADRTQRRGDRLRRLRGAVREARHRSDRQVGPHRAANGTRWSACSANGRRRAASAVPDDFVVIPYTAYRKQFGLRAERVAAAPAAFAVMIAVLPSEGVTREEAMAEVETIMRIRHGLTLDKPNDFDLGHRGRDPRLLGPDSARRPSSRSSSSRRSR